MRKRLALLSIALIVSHTLQASEDLVASALAAEARFDSQSALALFRQAEAARPSDPFILQKISRQLSDSTNDTTDVPEKKRLATEALSYAERAVRQDGQNPVNVLSLAICHGKLASYSDTRTKVAYSRLVREEAERSLALDPNYDWAHHVLGRWHYEVASLGTAARWAVKLIYGGLPGASTDQAIEHLRRAVELAPNTVAHPIELGFAWLAAGKSREARAAFELGLSLPSREKHDEHAKQRARKALAGLSVPRK